MKSSLDSSNFLEEISILSHSIVFLISLQWLWRKAFLSLLGTLWNSAFQWTYFMGFLFLLPFPSLFSAICMASSENNFVFLHFIFLGMVLITASCTMSWTFVYSSSGTPSIKCNPLNLFVTFTVWLWESWCRSHLNGLVVFPSFFNLSLNLAIRSS